MRDRQDIENMQANEEVRGVYLVASSSSQQSRNGPYWRVELRDSTGTLEAKIWSPLSTNFETIPAGSFVMLEGRTSLYREQVQLTIDGMRFLSEEESAGLDYSHFMPTSPRPPAEMLEELEALCERILTHKPWRKFARSVLKNEGIRARLLLAPAAKSVHHAYCGGLLEHTLSVCGICMHVADHFNGELDRQVLFCGALFHDLGKIWEMSGGLVNDYTDSGRMLGHIVQGLAMLEPYLAKSGLEEHLALHFKHLIASHHGKKEFGSPSVPATAEAFVLHSADDIDAKVAQLRGLWSGSKASPSTSTGEKPGNLADADNPDNGDNACYGHVEWSPWVRLLDRQVARLPHTPEKPAKSARPDKDNDGKPTIKEKDSQQCSLL